MKKRIIILTSIIFLMIISIFIIVGIQKKKDKEELIMNFYDNVFTNSILLENLANDMVNNWHDAIFNDKYDNIEDAIKSAIEKNSSTITEINNNDFIIDTQYSTIRKLSDKETNSTAIAIKETYNTYYKLYNLVTDPSGKNYNEFISSYNEISEELIVNMNELNILIN